MKIILKQILIKNKKQNQNLFYKKNYWICI